MKYKKKAPPAQQPAERKKRRKPAWALALHRALLARVQRSFSGLKGRWLVNSFSLVVLILAAVIIYAVLVIALRIITYEDCMLLPKGNKIAKILRIR